MRSTPRTRRTHALTTLLTTAALALGLTGCGTNGYDATYPADARKAVRTGAEGAFAQGPHGPVDCAKAKCVALTFDTGPSVRTPQILGILRKYHVHATFFTLGKNHVLKHPETVKAMATQGHELETLTWDHRILTKISEAEARKEITQGRDAVEKVAGVRPTLVRPPQGRTNDSVTAICRELGMAQVEWSANGADYRTTDSASISKQILEQTERDGIILLHDKVDPTGKGYNGTVAAVSPIISGLQARGYTFVTVSQLIAPGKPQPGAVYK